MKLNRNVGLLVLAVASIGGAAGVTYAQTTAPARASAQRYQVHLTLFLSLRFQPTPAGVLKTSAAHFDRHLLGQLIHYVLGRLNIFRWSNLPTSIVFLKNTHNSTS